MANDETERLRYDEAHWAREADEQRALEQYLALADREYNRTKSRLFMTLLGDPEGKRVLDFGGGAGVLAIPCAKAGAHVVLVDAEENALSTARRYAEREGVSERIECVCALTVPPEFQNGSFDIVIAKDVFEHVPEDELLMRSLARCQSPGGTLVLSTQNSWSMNYLIEGTYQRYWCGNRDWLGWDQTHVRFYEPSSLKRKLRDAGYHVDGWASVYLVPYDILSWLTFGKVKIQLPALHKLDLWLGRHFPFNRLGWNILVRGVRA